MVLARRASDDPASGALLGLLKTESTDAKCLAFSPDGKTVAVGAGPSVAFFDAHKGKKLAEWEAHSAGVLAVAFSPDGQTLVTAGDDDHLSLWDPATGKERDRLDLHEKGASVLAFSPDGKYLAAGGEAGELTVWRMSDEDERRRLVGRHGGVGYIAFAPDGNSFLWTQGKTIRVSEVETWVELARFTGRDMDATCFALSPDGKTLATGGKVIHLWDLETGAHLLQFHDEKSDAAALLFAPDGKTLASAAPDGAILIWDLKRLPRSRLEWLWRELSGNDAADAVHAVRAMKATPAASIAFLRQRIRPAPPPASDVEQLVADLDNDDFAHARKGDGGVGETRPQSGGGATASLREEAFGRDALPPGNPARPSQGRTQRRDGQGPGRPSLGNHRRWRRSRLPRNIGERAARFTHNAGSQGVAATLERSSFAVAGAGARNVERRCAYTISVGRWPGWAVSRTARAMACRAGLLFAVAGPPCNPCSKPPGFSTLTILLGKREA